MRLSALALSGFLLVAGAVRPSLAQKPVPSCPAADSLLPRGRRGGGLKVEYSQFTDSTTLTTKTGMRGFTLVTIVASGRGLRLLPDSLRIVFAYEERQPQLSVATPASDFAQLSAAFSVFLLLDGQQRLALTGGTYTSSVQNGYGLVPNSLIERLEYPLTREQLTQIAAASTVEMKARTFEAEVAEKVLEGARDLVRYLACGATSS